MCRSSVQTKLSPGTLETEARSLQSHESKRAWQKRKLHTFCGLLRRAEQRATCCTETEKEEEKKKLVLQSLACFGFLMTSEAARSAEELESYFAQPERWISKSRAQS